MMISIAIPGTSGCGAETFTKNLAQWLKSEGKLSKLYTAFGDADFKENNVILGELRAARALVPFWRQAESDHAGSFLLTLGYINLSICLRLRIKRTRIVIRICNPPTEEMKLLSRVKLMRYWLSARLSCSLADHIIVQSEQMKTSLLSAKLASERKISTIHNPVRETTWKQRNTERPYEVPYVLCASSNKPQKDLPTLISAFSRIQNETSRHLILAGVNKNDALILQAIRNSGADPDRVHCLGFVENVYNLIEHADLCVLPSIFEGFSNFLLESAAYGKRIIATDCPGGNSDLFKRYDNHKVVPVGAISEMSMALLMARHDLRLEECRRMLHDFDQGAIFNKYVSILNPG
jgi:glycosyltransferase involved in cell wall biosynthesis